MKIKDMIGCGLIIILTPKKKYSKKLYRPNGIYPIIDQGKEYIAGWIEENEYAFPKDEYLIFGDHTEIFKYVNFAFCQGNDGLKILKCNNQILTPFLYYILSKNYKPKGCYSRHFKFLLETKIFIPNIQVQEKIVSILDKFDLLSNSISEGLPKEIELRHKQYEYYRNKLLCFKEAKNE